MLAYCLVSNLMVSVNMTLFRQIKSCNLVKRTMELHELLNVYFTKTMFVHS